jgi:hypothetical protein
MAWLEQRSGLYRVAFRHGGRKLHYSVSSDNQKEAKACMARLEENLRLVERGRLEVPAGADLTPGRTLPRRPEAHRARRSE